MATNNASLNKTQLDSNFRGCLELDDVSVNKNPPDRPDSKYFPGTDQSTSEKAMSYNLLKNENLPQSVADRSSNFPSNSMHIALPTVPEKIDFLHIDSSESDDEQQHLHDNVNNLLNSAAILNDFACGPDKPSDLYAALSTNEPPVVGFISTDLAKPKNPQLDFSGYEKENRTYNQIFNQEASHSGEVPQKRLKSDITPVIDNQNSSSFDVCVNNGSHLSKTLIYRKDERIITSQKNISRIPSHINQVYNSHASAVSTLQWCVSHYSHLLLSASIDCSLKIWDIFGKTHVQYFKHDFALKAARWSLSGEVVLTGGYGKKAHVYDVLSGKEIVSYDVNNVLSSIVMHPFEEGVFLCGTHNSVLAFDLRVNSKLPVKKFISKCEEVLDIAFLNGNEFVCSTSVVSHDSADRTIMVWDFDSGAILSNQIFLERYTCPSLKVHPCYHSFVAQTNGDYIAAFSTQRPYKIKNKRYMGHKVSGYGVECDISPDGMYLVSGDANGDIYFYNYTESNLLHKLSAKSGSATNKVKWHPVLSSTIATATWDGQIQIWK